MGDIASHIISKIINFSLNGKQQLFMKLNLIMIMMIINKSNLISFYLGVLFNHVEFLYGFLGHISIIFGFLWLFLVLIENSDGFENGILFSIVFLLIFFIFKLDFNIEVIIELLLTFFILLMDVLMILMIKHFDPIIRFNIFNRNILISIFPLKSINMNANNH